MNAMKAGCLLLTILLLASCRKLEPEAPKEGYGSSSSTAAGGENSAWTGNLANVDSAVGIKLAAFGTDTPEWLTIDQMLQAEDWQEVECDATPEDAWLPGSGTHTLDAEGWLTDMPIDGSCVGLRLFQQARGTYPSGRYIIKYEGAGEFAITGDAELITTLEVGLSAFDVEDSSTDGVLLKISSLRENDPLRNIQIIAPGGLCGLSEDELDPFSYCSTDRGGEGSCATGMTCYDFADITINPFSEAELEDFNDLVSNAQKALFHPVFLQGLKNYRSISFERWLMPSGMSANARVSIASNVAHFAGDQGAPWELMTALANILGADPWLTLPADISDADLESLAARFAADLREDLSIYLEYAGEFWAADARDYMEEQALASGLDSFEAFYTGRMREIASIWEEAFGNAADALRFVMTIKADDADMPERLILANPGSSPFDVLAVAMRFELPRINSSDAESIDQFFESVMGGASVASSASTLGQSEALMVEMGNIARGLGLAFMAYGSGPLFSNALVANDLREEARDDERMADAITRMLESWKEAGGRMSIFDKSADDLDQYGPHPWGAIRNQADVDSRIQGALYDFIDDNPCWWDACERD